MKLVSRLFVVLSAVVVFLWLDSYAVFAAESVVDFAIPVETSRRVYGIALIRRDNTVKILPMDQMVRRATVSPDGFRIAYVTRDREYFRVFMCTADGQNKKLVEAYRSDINNSQDFIDVKFIKNGKSLLISRYLKNQLGFVEYNLAAGKPRFLAKKEWQGAPASIYRTDGYQNGCLVFVKTNNVGNKVIQQIWGAGTQDESYTIFFEIEAPPSIIDMVPDMNRKRVFIVGTPTRHVSVRHTNKSLMLVTSSKEQPKKLVDDTSFLNLSISNDGNQIAWQTSGYESGLKFKKYNVNTGETTEIATENADEQKEELKLGTITPSK